MFALDTVFLVQVGPSLHCAVERALKQWFQQQICRPFRCGLPRPAGASPISTGETDGAFLNPAMTTQTPQTSEIKALKKVLEEITSSVKNTVAQCIHAGAMLTRIKAKTKHGDWNTVLESVDLAYHTAERYMLLWEYRTKLDLSKVKTITEASDVISKIARFAIPTTMNERVTNEKSSPLAPQRRSNFDPDPTPRNHSNDYTSATVSSNGVPRGTDPIDMAEPRLHTTKEDSALAYEFAGYPKTIEVTVRSEEEETQVRQLIADFAAQHGETEKASITPARDLIGKLARTYKEVTGRTLLISGADAAQVKRLIQMNGISCSEEIVLTFKTACQAKTGWYATKSHQLSTFVQNYNNIRNELNNPISSTVGKRNPRLEGVCRNDQLNDYAALAAAKCKMDAERAQAAMRGVAATQAT